LYTTSFNCQLINLKAGVIIVSILQIKWNHRKAKEIIQQVAAQDLDQGQPGYKNCALCP
jgi:hypothetical protein